MRALAVFLLLWSHARGLDRTARTTLRLDSSTCARQRRSKKPPPEMPRVSVKRGRLVAALASHIRLDRPRPRCPQVPTIPTHASIPNIHQSRQVASSGIEIDRSSRPVADERTHTHTRASHASENPHPHATDHHAGRRRVLIHPNQPNNPPTKQGRRSHPWRTRRTRVGAGPRPGGRGSSSRSPGPGPRPGAGGRRQAQGPHRGRHHEPGVPRRVALGPGAGAAVAARRAVGGDGQ